MSKFNKVCTSCWYFGCTLKVAYVLGTKSGTSNGAPLLSLNFLERTKLFWFTKYCRPFGADPARFENLRMMTKFYGVGGFVQTVPSG